ncbi:hexokinase [Pterulicium gracile]|uniref:Phosphotransferase n=1 Tax=Pterulicium gracile TaxID=1884261 RepID=A0A5C3QJF4_9AGAR|nr:hexokinase [Pterula gracilis]
MAPTSAVFSREHQKVIDDINDQFQLPNESLISITKAFLDEYSKGLSAYGHPMAMIPTFVTGTPDGTEKGTFLALDLGGTNMRVCEVNLRGDKTFTIRQQKYRVSDALKTGEARALFDYLADSVDAFLSAEAQHADASESQPKFVPLGLTFSFPVEQTALDSGKILTWTKGFAATNAIGNDVVRLLQDAFDRKHLHVKCVALVNDTVGALLSRAYASGGCTLGAIFGTGTNGAFMDDVSKITKLGPNHPAISRGGQMVVNTEWGAFNNSRTHLPSTPFDKTMDRQSINPGFQAFEKFISGMYLGEIVRHILLALIDSAPQPILFNGASTTSLNLQWGIDTSVMSDVEDAWGAGSTDGDPVLETIVPNLEKLESLKGDKVHEKLEKVRKIVVEKLGFKDEQVSVKDAAIVRWACSLVARRAALLSGIAVAATLIQTEHAVLQEGSTTAKPKKHTDRAIIGVDGSLIEFYPNYERTLRESLRALVGEEIEKKVDIGLAKDGSGAGAALCALQAIKNTTQ